MGIIRKIYDQGEKTVNNIKKKYHNPLKEFEKEINNLKAYLKESKSLAAHINALKIRAEKDIEDYKEQVKKYQAKAEEAIQNGASNKIPENAEEKISITALKFKKTYQDKVDELKNKIPVYDEELKALKEKISDLKIKIDYYENEYNFLKSQKIESKDISSNLFYSDSGIIARLERLKDVILKQNITSKVYSEKSDEMYKDVKTDDVYDEYANLKKKFKK